MIGIAAIKSNPVFLGVRLCRIPRKILLALIPPARPLFGRLAQVNSNKTVLTGFEHPIRYISIGVLLSQAL